VLVRRALVAMKAEAEAAEFLAAQAEQIAKTGPEKKS
jgi:hypothetical protein